MSGKKKKPDAPRPERNKEEARPSAEENLPYTLGSWKGITQYRCKRCPFDTLNPADMQEHITARHASAPNRLVDRFGNPIT